MFKFCFMYLDDDSSTFALPLSPEEFTTKVGNKNKTVDLIEMGETNIIKKIGLRDFSFSIVLPKDSQLCDDESLCREPIFFLNKFREFKTEKKVVCMVITRDMPDGSSIFNGNIEVTLEDYTVTEKAGEPGDFYVDLNFKEYKRIAVIKTNVTENATKDGKTEVTQVEQRAAREAAESYTVKQGDSLWSIAKLQLNDGSRYREIASLNGITDYNNLQVGTVLKLP